MRGQFVSIQCSTGSSMSAMPAVGVFHRSLTTKKSTFFSASHFWFGFDMFMMSPVEHQPNLRGYGSPVSIVLNSTASSANAATT